MVRLRRDGIFPVAFAAIRTPVLMLHGDADHAFFETLETWLAAALDSR